MITKILLYVRSGFQVAIQKSLTAIFAHEHLTPDKVNRIVGYFDNWTIGWKILWKDLVFQEAWLKQGGPVVSAGMELTYEARKEGWLGGYNSLLVNRAPCVCMDKRISRESIMHADASTQ